MFLEELTKLATNTSAIVVILLVVGVVFCFIEAIVPSFGFWGITGILSTIAGIVVHAIVSGSALQVLFILIILSAIFAVIILLFIRSAKYGLLSKISLVENKTALPIYHQNSINQDLVHLIGKEGVTATECRPIGKIKIDDKVYEAIAKGKFLDKNINVVVSGVEGRSIYVDQI